MLSITILTAGITRDTLDNASALTDEAWPTERARYIGLLCEAARVVYPDAEIDTSEGNGLDSVHVSSDNPDAIIGDMEAEDAERILGYAWEGIFESWLDSIPATAWADDVLEY